MIQLNASSKIRCIPPTIFTKDIGKSNSDGVTWNELHAHDLASFKTTLLNYLTEESCATFDRNLS